MITNLTSTLASLNAVVHETIEAAKVHDQATKLRDRMAAQRAAIRDDERDYMDIDPFGVDGKHD